MPRRKLFTLSAGLALASPAFAQEPVYWPVVPHVFCGRVSARAINDRGQIAGIEETHPLQLAPILWTDGVPGALPTPGASPLILGLDDDGRAVGTVVIDYESRAVLWEASEALLLPFDVATGIDDGRIVGRRRVEGGMRAVLWEDGELTDLGNLGGGAAEPSAIRGKRVVGISRNAEGGPHAFFWEDGLMQDLGTLGGRISQANDINARGQVVGYSETSDGGRRAFLWEGGRMRDLGTFGAEYSMAVAIDDEGRILANVGVGTDRRYAILADGSEVQVIEREGANLEAHGLNERGQVVGTVGDDAFVWENGELRILARTRRCGEVLARPPDWCIRAIAVDVGSDGTVVGNGLNILDEGTWGAFAWKGDTARYLGTLGGPMSEVRAVNGLGTAVGRTVDSAGNWQPFLWEDGQMRSLLPLQDADAINDAGQIVGRVLDERGRIRVALREADSMRLLPTLGRHSQANDISESGVLAGWSEPSPGDTRAVLWRGDEIVELGTLGGQTTEPLAINEHGIVVGRGTNAENEPRAFVWDEAGGIRVLAGLEDVSGVAMDIDESGRIVGWMEAVRAFPLGERTQRRAFLWEDGRVTDLGNLAARPDPDDQTEALAINDRGLVVGVSVGRAFLYRNGEMLSLGVPCSDNLTPHAPNRPAHPAE